MSDSYKKLIKKMARGSVNAHEELARRQREYIFTGLKGLNEEDIVLRMTEHVTDLIRYVSDEIQNIKNIGTVSEAILLDCFASATIEGARTTVERIKEVFNSPKTKDDKMVVNTIKVQNLAYKYGISNDNIRRLWETLVDGVCENLQSDGKKYRSAMVYVGSVTRIIHKPEKPCNIDRRMESLFSFCNSNEDTILKACIMHFYFVYIHPFCDGNGRFARLWMNYILSCINDNYKGVTISKEINKELAGYYSSITESEFSYNHIIDITPFVEYVVECVASAVDYAKYKRYQHLSELEQRVLSKISKNNSGITVKKLSVIMSLTEGEAEDVLTGLANKRYLIADNQGEESRYFVK